MWLLANNDHPLLTVAPLSVEILEKSRPPVSGRNRTVACRVVGARPTPSIKWFRNDYEIRGATIQVVTILQQERGKIMTYWQPRMGVHWEKFQIIRNHRLCYLKKKKSTKRFLHELGYEICFCKELFKGIIHPDILKFSSSNYCYLSSS